MKVEATVIRFYKVEEKYGKRPVLVVKMPGQIDELTGLPYDAVHHYLTMPGVRVDRLIGHKVWLELTQSPTLKFPVITGIEVEVG